MGKNYQDMTEWGCPSRMELRKTQRKIRSLYDELHGPDAYSKIEVPKDVKESKAKVDINVSKKEPPEIMSAESHHRYKAAKEKLAKYGGTKTQYGAGIAAAVEKKLKKKKGNKKMTKSLPHAERLRKWAGDTKPIAPSAEEGEILEKALSAKKQVKLTDDEAEALAKARIRREIKYYMAPWLDDEPVDEWEQKRYEKKMAKGIDSCLQEAADTVLSQAASSYESDALIRGIRKMGGVKKLPEVMKSEFGAMCASRKAAKEAKQNQGTQQVASTPQKMEPSYY